MKTMQVLTSYIRYLHGFPSYSVIFLTCLGVNALLVVSYPLARNAFVATGTCLFGKDHSAKRTVKQFFPIEIAYGIRCKRNRF